MGVVATQSNSSGPVEVSWSLPADRANVIPGRNLLFSSYVTSILLNFVESGQIESVPIRSESEQLPSELISVTVKIAGTLA